MDEDNDLFRRSAGPSNLRNKPILKRYIPHSQRGHPHLNKTRSQSLHNYGSTRGFQNPTRMHATPVQPMYENYQNLSHQFPNQRAQHSREQRTPVQTVNRHHANMSDQRNFSINKNSSNGRNAQGGGKKTRTMGFLTLEALAKSDVKDILTNLNDKKEAFSNLLQSPIERLDVYVLVMQILSKICESSFDQLKLNVLLEVCNSQFITNLRNYLMDLPYPERKNINNKYWQNEVEFWKNYITFCECIIIMSPSTALNKCRSLVEGTSKCCLEALRERHNFILPEEYNVKLIQLRETLTAHEIENNKKEERKRDHYVEEQEPPENFRELSVVPRREDLVEEHPYLRANLIKGKYRDVEHYLDVQFRLLREDCFGPLRDGIRQFMRDPTKKKYDHIRVFRNVRFVESYASPQKVGFYVEFDEHTKRRFKKIIWSHSKRFIFGSLVLFTKDNCNSFIVATIIDRDVKYLDKGKIPVSLVDIEVDDLFKNDAYTMIESEVYFEPYYHILKALQDPTFPQHIAMKKYIIDVDPQPTHPRYLDAEKTYNVDLSLYQETTFTVLDSDTWPSSDDLKLNTSQYEAYKTALTQEFAVIQGPPGTGKTYLGIKVAQTLLENISSSGCLLLLVCYTNHALDQFLEALIPVTDSIVRIGGRSRNEAMERFNLSELRKKTRLSHSVYRLFAEQREKLKSCILQLQRAQKVLDSVNNSIISFACIQKYVPECNIIGDLYKTTLNSGKDPMCHWLFEYLEYDLNEPIPFEGNENKEQDNVLPVDGDDDEDRNEVILDDLEISVNKFYIGKIQNAFSLESAETNLNYMIQQFHADTHKKFKREQYVDIVVLRARIRLFKEMKEYYLQGNHTKQMNEGDDLTNYSMADRWIMYFNWTKLVTDELKKDIIPLQEAVKNANTVYEEARMLLDHNLLKNVKVVGMTTSGAARLRKLLQGLAPPIVIVEEAAEVLEQHIITSLTKNCQHLILIGDHQQLRPSAAHMRLAKHFNLEVSLFERMILNEMHSRRLRVQHRMRPHIAALIRPHVYPDLEDHPSVARFPDVRGVAANLFFFTHDYREEAVDDSSSRTNKKEGDMTLSLANYIMQQGYEPEDVTILAAYSGQMFYLRKQRPLYYHLSKVKITVVDNYQGEESKIILLSLVRNNDENKIGFLGMKNRICVALSRAKEGFYIFGNIDILKGNSSLWTKIAETLQSQGSLGTSLKLKCETHETITTISSIDDFKKVPEGGCLLKCNYNLPCLHACPLVCHSYDRGHVTTKCPLKCERIICELQHVCPLMCKDKCKPCMKMVTKTLPCGHDMKVFCHLDPTSRQIKCVTIVPVTLPRCGHEVKKSCYMDTEDVTCPVPCGLHVERCGHACTRKCHVDDDPDHEHYICQKPCVKAKKGCTMALEGDLGDHQCRKQCHEICDDCNIEVLKKRSSCKHKELVACSRSADDVPCRKKCARTLPCGHFCKKKCCETCGDCRAKVKKVIPECGHEVEVECRMEARRALCERACERTLACGHACRQRCRDECSAAACAELLPTRFDAPCGHRVQLPCNVLSAQNGSPSPESLLKHCREPCGVELACEHACAGTCASCFRGCLHQPCAQRCRQTNICGHECEEPCSQLCPPCNKNCEMKCVHARCPRPCGAPCVPCQERCGRACTHGRCTRRCGERCSRDACTQRCARTLSCGHRCRGLCGERCPDVCKPCRPDDFPTDFLGDEFDDDALFIVLEDCGHIMEFENMEHLMNSESESISLRACPFCRKPIINTPRYKDLVNNRFKNDINPIKERVYGNIQQNQDAKKKLLEEMSTFHEIHNKIYTDKQFSDWKKAFNKLFHFVNTKKKYSLLQLNMHFVYLNILEMLSEIYMKFNTAKLTELYSHLVEKTSMICCVLFNNIQKISQQQQMDIRNEMKRMNSIVQFSKILSHQAYIMNKNNPKVIVATETAKKLIVGFGIYNADNAMDALKNLQDIVKASGIITKEERDLIVKAIGAKAGQWYKCPNGHFYSIGQCGGAMEISRCIECKVEIGGQNHRLLSSNQHAPEIDNSKFPAWSVEANNMANFNIDDLL